MGASNHMKCCCDSENPSALCRLSNGSYAVITRYGVNVWTRRILPTGYTPFAINHSPTETCIVHAYNASNIIYKISYIDNEWVAESLELAYDSTNYSHYVDNDLYLHAIGSVVDPKTASAYFIHKTQSGTTWASNSIYIPYIANTIKPVFTESGIEYAIQNHQDVVEHPTNGLIIVFLYNESGNKVFSNVLANNHRNANVSNAIKSISGNYHFVKSEGSASYDGITTAWIEINSTGGLVSAALLSINQAVEFSNTQTGIVCFKNSNARLAYYLLPGGTQTLLDVESSAISDYKACADNRNIYCVYMVGSSLIAYISNATTKREDTSYTGITNILDVSCVNGYNEKL